ncbi:hypothetical protein [Ottowia testudinis]|uniref:Uncharacterized protein n=1 Tax=Ottowia testudinis TaxID=2816950 RepID=A0A975CKC7_9BURK|nr:hypothetical protein [Ottowia testudinis]QTD45043.1 hypothetical protein J1M35_18745 [Ottowia testudinis]
MKKFAVTAIAAAAALGAGVAQAYTQGTFSNGFVVPNAYHEGMGNTTAVGITNASAAPVSVYWTFFDQDSNHVTDGCFVMTGKDYEPFVWAAKSGTGLEKARGYLVFAQGATAPAAGKCAANDTLASPASGMISGSAFQVITGSQDVGYTPVIDGPLTIGGAPTDLTTLGPNSLTAVAGAAPVGNVMTMRYFVDGAAAGNDTAIAVWSVGDQRGTHTVNMYDDKQERKSVNFALTKKELDWFNPETIGGRPAHFTDGFIEWNTGVVPGDYPGLVPAEALGSKPGVLGVFTFSVINSPAFGAMQTILGAHRAP